MLTGMPYRRPSLCDSMSSSCFRLSVRTPVLQFSFLFTSRACRTRDKPRIQFLLHTHTHTKTFYHFSITYLQPLWSRLSYHMVTIKLLFIHLPSFWSMCEVKSNKLTYSIDCLRIESFSSNTVKAKWHDVSEPHHRSFNLFLFMQWIRCVNLIFKEPVCVQVLFQSSRGQNQIPPV